MTLGKPLVFYDYWRSSAGYRVRIALNLLGLDYESVQINLLEKKHKAPDYLLKNPQGLVPSLAIGDQLYTQSLSIIEYLHERNPTSSILPQNPEDKVRVRQLAHLIAMDIHPVCNLSIVSRIVEIADKSKVNGDEIRQDWMRHHIAKGLGAFEALLDHEQTGPFCHGSEPTLADICLVPQVYNALRWGADISDLNRIQAVLSHCAEQSAFADAHPDQVNQLSSG